ncbi:MAG TPA: DUF6680 family protein [Candidatus Angelobacter sp.]|jgi:hypothetical protein
MTLQTPCVPDHSTSLEWITVAAIIAGPVLALLFQRLLDNWREHSKRRTSLFFTLMATRARASFQLPEHVQALNSIDVAFSNDGEIRRLWKLVLDHLAIDENSAGWADKLDDLRVDLYQAIGNKLGYRYTTDYIKRGIYFPQYHLNFYNNQNQIYAGLAQALSSGKLEVKLSQENPPTVAQPQPPVRRG